MRTTMMKKILEKIKRNWYLYGGVSLLFIAGHFHNDLLETIVHFAGIMFLVTATANLLLHAFTVIHWRDWKDNQEFEIVGKCIVIAAVFLGCSFVAGSMFTGEHGNTKVDTLNEEIQLQDSTTAHTIDSLKALPIDTLESLPK